MEEWRYSSTHLQHGPIWWVPGCLISRGTPFLPNPVHTEAVGVTPAPHTTVQFPSLALSGSPSMSLHSNNGPKKQPFVHRDSSWWPWPTWRLPSSWTVISHDFLPFYSFWTASSCCLSSPTFMSKRTERGKSRTEDNTSANKGRQRTILICWIILQSGNY